MTDDNRPQDQDEPQPDDLSEEHGSRDEAESEAPEPSEATRASTRRRIIAAREQRRRKNRPYVILGAVVLLALLAIPGVAFVRKFVIPPTRLAVQVENVKYTQGDVVNYLRYEERLAEQQNKTKFQIGNSIFQAEQDIMNNEIAYQGATAMGITVPPSDVDAEIRAQLGYPNVTEQDLQKNPELKSQIQEAEFEFLNNTGLSESTYRNIITKQLYAQKVQAKVAESVPRVQPQVHLYEILLNTPDKQTAEQVRRGLSAGQSISELAFKYSIDGPLRRKGGDDGWVPKGVVPEWDSMLFGTTTPGGPGLPTGQLSDPVRVPASQQSSSSGSSQQQSSSQSKPTYALVYIAARSNARPVDDQSFKVLSQNAYNSWLQQEREKLHVKIILNSSVYNWIVQQVEAASVAPTATPPPSGNYQLNAQGTPVSVPNGSGG